MSEVLGLLLGMCVVLGPGALSAADEGVLERVAERRIKYGYGLGAEVAVEGYEALLGVTDCGLMGSEGVLLAGGEIYTALVVDCSQGKHRGLLEARGLVADVNVGSLAHETGVVILWGEGGD